MSYVQGTVVRVSAKFTDGAGAPVEPNEVVLRIEPPKTQPIELRLSDGEVLNDPNVAGGYYSDIETELGPPGTWTYQFENPGSTRVTARKQLTIRGRI